MSEIKTIKLRSGGKNIWLSLEDNMGGQMPRSFNLTPGRDTVIPINYAMTLFTYGAIEAMYRNNEFKITQNEEEYFKLLSGEYVEVDVEGKADDKEIMEILQGNNITEIKKLLESNIGERTKAIIIENQDTLSRIVLKALESYTGLIITD